MDLPGYLIMSNFMQSILTYSIEQLKTPCQIVNEKILSAWVKNPLSDLNIDSFDKKNYAETWQKVFDFASIFLKKRGKLIGDGPMIKKLREGDLTVPEGVNLLQVFAYLNIY